MSKRERSDPLLDEVRRIRKRTWREHGNDPRRLYDHYAEMDRKHAGPGTSASQPAQPGRDQSAA